MLAPVVFAVSETVVPGAEAVTGADESALIVDAKAEAMDEGVVAEPLQLTVLLWPLTVIVLVPESYRVV